MNGAYDELVAGSGLAHSHRLVLGEVRAGARVLDVGCAGGYLATALLERGHVVLGIEPDAAAAAAARDRGVEVVEGGFDDPRVRADLDAASFDAVLLADVLEHLADPWEALAHTRTLLAPGGRAIVSVPNIANWTARRDVARGRFDYAPHGIFDRTHLRFFTRATARELAARAGFSVVAERFATGPLPLERFARARLGGTEQQPAPAVARLREALTRRAPELFALQFVLVLKPLR